MVLLEVMCLGGFLDFRLMTYSIVSIDIAWIYPALLVMVSNVGSILEAVLGGLCDFPCNLVLWSFPITT